MKKKHNPLIHDANAASDMGRRSFFYFPVINLFLPWFVITLDFDFDMNRYDIIC